MPFGVIGAAVGNARRPTRRKPPAEQHASYRDLLTEYIRELPQEGHRRLGGVGERKLTAEIASVSGA